jgi:hypothetical protein
MKSPSRPRPIKPGAQCEQGPLLADTGNREEVVGLVPRSVALIAAIGKSYSAES